MNNLYSDRFVKTRGPVPRKVVKLNPRLSIILRMVFLSKNVYLVLSKYC